MSNDANKGYQFVIANGTVSAVYEIKNGRTKLEKMDHDETWSVSGTNVIKTEFDDGRLETTTYSDANGDGIFAKVSKVVSASPAPTGAGENHVTDDDNDAQAHGADSNRDDDHAMHSTADHDALHSANSKDRTTGADDDNHLSGHADADDFLDFIFLASAGNLSLNNETESKHDDNDAHAGSHDLHGETDHHIELLGVASWTATDLM